MNFCDLYSLSLHRLIAERLRDDPDSVIGIARANLRRWLSSEAFSEGSGRRALLEWVEILDTRTYDEIIAILTEETDEGQRLRSSTPFPGILTKQERDVVWKKCAEIVPV